MATNEFFAKICDIEAIINNSSKAFTGGKSGELFVEYVENENICLTNGVLTNCVANQSSGFGLRSYLGDKFSYIHSSDLSEGSVKNAVKESEFASRFYGESICHGDKIVRQNIDQNLYPSDKFIASLSLQDKIDFLRKLEAKVREKSQNVQTVTSRLVSSWQVVLVAKSNGVTVGDIRPLVRLTLFVILAKNGTTESGSFSAGGRYLYDELLTDENVEKFASEAIRTAEIKFESKPAPAGELPVVLGNGWTGILLHEAIGHGLEADANRKGTSVFSTLMGETIAAKGVTVVDDGTINGKRGSINIDDEGNSSQCTTLIEDGKLVGYMYDEMNAALMNSCQTGNGRRESYAHPPLARMTNTMMLSGNATQEEMISQVKYGIFAKSFADGQVDTTSGNFVFSSSEAYLIEDGKITQPVKGAMLIGNGPQILTHIQAIGNDSKLDEGVGTCGKDGQWVPVGVGMPSILIDKITVGGSQI